mmetsp:Transcript_23844/g.51520  ORF Transcript_23844/g.51520 Transcript_23844/m.51520 type:complete len:243 (-) Transcript_23844:712-1440(-)
MVQSQIGWYFATALSTTTTSPYIINMTIFCFIISTNTLLAALPQKEKRRRHTLRQKCKILRPHGRFHRRVLPALRNQSRHLGRKRIQPIIIHRHRIMIFRKRRRCNLASVRPRRIRGNVNQPLPQFQQGIVAQCTYRPAQHRLVGYDIERSVPRSNLRYRYHTAFQRVHTTAQERLHVHDHCRARYNGIFDQVRKSCMTAHSFDYQCEHVSSSEHGSRAKTNVSAGQCRPYVHGECVGWRRV